MIYMADNLFVYKMQVIVGENVNHQNYVVMDEYGKILKTAKTVKTCDNYVQKILTKRRADEKINQNKI